MTDIEKTCENCEYEYEDGEHCKRCIHLDTCYKVAKYEIDNIPTVYDVDKVVEETEDYLNGWVTIDASEKISEIIRKGGME